MDCNSCGPLATRPDRPHTFFRHERASCGGCGASIEGRVVLRAGKVVRLDFCVTCGERESPVADDADAYVAAFVASGQVPESAAGDHLFKHTTSTCPKCLALLDAEVVIRSGQVFFKKQCATCGPSEALVSEDANHYV